jgi:superfamily II DNA or RNA helicase
MATNIYFIGQKDKPNWFGVGETKGPLMIEEYGIPRRGSDYNKSRDACVVYTEISFWKNVSTRNDVDVKHDKIIHDWLETIPGITRVGTESFEINAYGLSIGLTHEKIAYMIEQEFFPKTPKTKKDLTLKKHQQKFLNKVLSSWEEWKEFLLFAKCRAGKSIMVLSAIARKGVKVSLIVSRYTSPIQSWKEDSKNFSTFNNIVFINLADKDYLEQIEYWYNTDKQLVLWTTIQGNNRWNKIPCDVDLIVYDEAHQGYNSTQFKKLRKKFDCQVLYVTGTAFSMVWDFSESNSYTYSYFEEQLDKKLGLNNAPSMRVILKKYETEEYKKLYGDDPDAMKNLFSIEKGETDFVQPSLVQDFYSETFGDQKHLKPKDRLLNGKFHIFMTLPSVAACHASVKYLEKTKFAPLVVTGDTKEDSDTIRKHVAENEYTIILTVSANVLGVTIPEIDTVINASEGESINFWTQFAFRGGSSDRDWDVIDFCPQRCLKTLREIFIAACENNPMIAEYIMLDFIPIIEWSNGFVIMTQEQVASILASDVTNTISLISNIVNSMDMDKLANCQFNLSLLSKEKNNGSKREVNDNGANGKGNIQRDGESSEKQDNSLVLTKKETILAILERVPLTIYHCIKSGIIPNSVHSLINTDHYVYNTLDAEKIIETLIFDEVIDVKSFSYRINQAVIDIQNSISIDECKTLEKLSCSRQSQQSMPVELIDDLFGDLF